jgi:glycine betaine/choline ABC-type transport system substrate-binding protein
MKPRTMSGAACVELTVALAACTSANGSASPAAGEPGCRHGRVVTAGLFNVLESVLLAEIYGRALAPNNFPVRILPNTGTREPADPALMNGLLPLVPQYAGSALELISPARLTTGSLRSLDAQVVLDGRRPRSMAEAWSRGQGLMQAGGVVR